MITTRRRTRSFEPVATDTVGSRSTRMRKGCGQVGITSAAALLCVPFILSAATASATATNLRAAFLREKRLLLQLPQGSAPAPAVTVAGPTMEQSPATGAAWAPWSHFGEALSSATTSGYHRHHRRKLRGRGLLGPGSAPPQCASRCGGCAPCRAVHVTVPPGTPITTMEYYPEAWRCKCGNRLYLP